ncbi:MAG TPA: S9 family peptidase [Steroidobacteraceae bacterium]|nr:S9 family peptidase [Steroidobacteraceae bacterium]
MPLSALRRVIALHRVIAGLSLAMLAAQAIANPSASANSHSLTPDELLRVQSVSDPQVSPDGAWVAYVVTSNDLQADEARSAIWMVSWDGAQRLALTGEGADTSRPRWSPDGHYLAYLATPTGSEKSEIMLLDRRGGEASQITGVTADIADYAWSPDGKRIVIAMDQADEAKTPKPIVIEAWHFKQDEEGYLAKGHERHLALLDVQSKRLEALTSDPAFNEDLPVWSPDGSQILFVRTKERPVDRDGREEIALIEPRPGATPHPLLRPFAPNNQKLAWSPDGKLITFLEGLEPRYNAYMQDHLYVVPASGGDPRPLTDKLDRAVQSYTFTSRSKIALSVEDDRVVYPAELAVSSGAITREGGAEPAVVSELSSAGGHTALIRTTDATPGEVYALEHGKVRKLTPHNDTWLSSVTLGRAEDIQFKAKDGTEIHGVVIKPPGFVTGRKYPTLLWIHGGPNGQDEHSLGLDGYQFEPQMFATRGFVVLRVNYRGSSGRGIAFAEAIYADWGDKEVADLLAGVDELVSAGIADPDHLAVGGWSYGGILTDYTIASDGRFKVAVSGAGSANQISMFGGDEYVLQYTHELGPPWTHTDLWLKVSYPFFHADRIHTPTLFLGGDKDFNVPVIGGEQMYEALRTLGVPAQLVVYPGQHHILTRPSFVKDLAERIPTWIDRYLAR